MAQHSAFFTVVHRDQNSRPDFVYPWDGSVATYVVASVNICRGMLRYPKIRAALASLARDFYRSDPRPWYRDPRHGWETMEDVVDVFINLILVSFLIVYVDDSITPGCFGCHPRRDWDHLFLPEDLSILLNGSRVRDMVAAGIRAAQTNNPNDYENKRFRTFIFMFANTFLHEIGHVLVTFLTKGRTWTPPRITAQVGGYSGDFHGEAGRNLETIIFGGTMEYYLDPADDESQPGVPHILKRSGAYRISQQSIDGTVRYHFHSPYRLEGPSVNPRTMGHWGDGYPPATPTDPIEWIIMDQFREYGRRVWVGPQSTIYQLPFHPGLRAQAA